MANDDYVPIEKRVSVEPLLTVSDAMLKVYTGNMGAGDGWALLCTPNCVGHAENMAQPIRATIRLACEDVRERCAMEADARLFAILQSFMAGSEDDIESNSIGNAIRELEL